jgi:glycosyltransferase involved in cell wall biosynthesis
MPELDITLVIPVRDEQRSLPRLLEAIAAQTRPPDAVIFVDSGSRDDTEALLARACSDHAGWRVIELPQGTPGSARNAGIGAAATSWVALTDAGAYPDRHWLERLARMAVPGVQLVWGHYQPIADTWFSRCAALAYVALMTSDTRGPVRSGSVASCLLTRSLWEQAGHFPDLRAAEDGIFVRRLEALAPVTAVAPEAVVWWQLQPGFASTFRRFRRYSEVNARAGEQRHWHHGVARMYLAAAPFLVLGLRRRRWLALPAAGAGLRVLKSIWQRREGRGLGWALNPARVATVAAILAVVDAGTFAGWLQAARPPRTTGG